MNVTNTQSIRSLRSSSVIGSGLVFSCNFNAVRALENKCLVHVFLGLVDIGIVGFPKTE